MGFEIQNRQRGQSVDVTRLRGFVARLVEAQPASAGGAFTVRLVSDRVIRGLNRRFRGRDTATDVLSFPAEGIAGIPADGELGDVVVSVETAARRAGAAGCARELEVLVLHGYLHLLGHDHERDDGRMMRLQRRLESRLCGEAGT